MGEAPFEEDVSRGPVELVQGLWLRRPEDRPIRGALLLEQGRSFGSGTHPTTRLAASALATRLAEGPARVIDVGSGTGVLALAAAKLGASSVTAIDRDVEAARQTARNARSNGLSVLCAAASPSAIKARYDFAVVNMGLDDVLAEATSIESLLAPDGLLYLTGSLIGDAKRVLKGIGKRRLHPLAIEAEGGWLGLLFIAGGIRPTRLPVTMK